MNEDAGLDVGCLLRRRGPAQSGIAMWVSPEAGNDVTMPTRLAEAELADWEELGRADGLFSLDQGDNPVGALKVVRALRVDERKREEHALPIVAQGLVVTVRKTLFGQGERPGIEAERPRGSSVEPARKLVDHDDER